MTGALMPQGDHVEGLVAATGRNGEGCEDRAVDLTGPTLDLDVVGQVHGPTLPKRLRDCNTLSVIYRAGKGGDDSAMDASAARTANIRRIVSEVGGPAEFVRQFGGSRWVQAQVSQWISETNPKGIGRKLARDLEAAIGLPEAALDRPPAERVAPSQSGRPDFDKIAGAVRIVHDWLAYEDEPSAGVYDPVMLGIAWEVVERSGQQVTPDNVVQFVRRFKQMVAEGEDGGERLLGQHRG